MGSTGASALGRQKPATSSGCASTLAAAAALPAAADAFLRLRRSFSRAVLTASLSGRTYAAWSSLGMAPATASMARQHAASTSGFSSVSSVTTASSSAARCVVTSCLLVLQKEATSSAAPRRLAASSRPLSISDTSTCRPSSCTDMAMAATASLAASCLGVPAGPAATASSAGTVDPMWLCRAGPATVASVPRARMLLTSRGCLSSLGTAKWKIWGRTLRMTRRPSRDSANLSSDSRPAIMDGTTLSTALPLPLPPLNRMAKASPAASRTVGLASHSAVCTAGSTSARCSASWWRLMFSRTSLRPKHTPCRVAASSELTPVRSMGMMRPSTLSPIFLHSSPRQRAAMVRWSSPSLASEEMSSCISMGSTCPSVLGVLTTTVFHTCSASVRTGYWGSDLTMYRRASTSLRLSIPSAARMASP
mmetsp:Transcript_19523/g.42349  ORF Transcript_19523/g.42349 Transcript_19523/m.42349 type:complete len:421 (-) Transcript_19523:2303-3565(-)